MATFVEKEIVHNGEKYIHSSVIAEKVGLKPKSVNNWIIRHESFMGDPTLCQVRNRGKLRMFYMSKKGFAAYCTMRDSARNTTPVNNQLNGTLAKQEFTSKAIDQTAEIQALLKDPVIALRFQQLEMEKRITALEEKSKVFTGLPAPTEEVPEFTPRMALRELINRYVASNGGSHGEAWSFLYDRFKAQFHVDLRARSRNTGKDKLAMAEELGVINKLYALAVRLFVI